MIFDLLTPPQSPRGQGQKIFYVARPIHGSYSHTKGLGSRRGEIGPAIEMHTDLKNVYMVYFIEKNRNFICLVLKLCKLSGLFLSAGPWPGPVNFQLGPIKSRCCRSARPVEFLPEKRLRSRCFRLKTSAVIGVLCKPWRPNDFACYRRLFFG